jgi:hypothetical protein
MRCRECAEGRRFAAGSVYCIRYGMIIREEHICRFMGGKEHGPAEDQREGSENKTELQDTRGGTAQLVPGILSGSGERTGLSGVEK